MVVRRFVAAMVALLPLAGPAANAETPVAAKVVREEALRLHYDPAGRPLPLIAHWHRQSMPLSFQVQMIQDGHPMLPWVDAIESWKPISNDDAAALATLRTWKLPLALISTQWEQDFYGSQAFRNLPIARTGLADDLAGNKTNMVSPMSPVEPWRILGRMWGDNANINSIQSAYPDPPLVLFLGNNEAPRLKWTGAKNSKTYLDAYGSGRSDEFKRNLFGDGWITRYTAMFQGMREGLSSEAWRTNSRFVGYNAFGPDHWGRWGDWKTYALVTDARIAPDWYMWNGAMVEAYDNDWEPEKKAFNYWSMQTELMNLVFMKNEALKVQPGYWFETIFWDGDQPVKSGDKPDQYASMGVTYNPQFYSGWVQYALWLLVPRVAREFRHSDDDRTRWWPYFEQIITAVERVHTGPVLRRFWRSGELVPNPAREHPFNNDLPAKWSDSSSYPRWFQLQTSVDPWLPSVPRPGAHYAIQLPVWALARVIGAKPDREWLVYAHAPLGERTNVRITVPSYTDVTLPKIAVQGSFYHVVESTGAVTEVGLTSGPLRPMENPMPSSDSLLLSADFNNGSLAGWSVRDEGTTSKPSKWRIVSGELAQLSNIYGGTRSTRELSKPGTYLLWDGGAPWTDYRARFVLSSEDHGGLGVMFRVKDADNYYRFAWNQQLRYRRLEKKERGVFSVLAGDAVPYVRSPDYNVEIVAKGTSLEVWIDGVRVLAADDAAHASGTIAFYSWMNTGVYIDNVQVNKTE